MQGNVDICRSTRVQLVAESRIMQADNYASRLCKQIMHILFFKMYEFVHVLFSNIIILLVGCTWLDLCQMVAQCTAGILRDLVRSANLWSQFLASACIAEGYGSLPPRSTSRSKSHEEECQRRQAWICASLILLWFILLPWRGVLCWT